MKGRASIEKGITGLGKLQKKVKEAHRNQGWIRSLDGRIIKTRSEHAALNTLLQSFGAVVMKYALIIFHFEKMVSLGFVSSDFLTCNRFGYVANIHDEIQVECEPEIAELVGKTLAESIVEAGVRLGVRCPLAGTYAIGDSWRETH